MSEPPASEGRSPEELLRWRKRLIAVLAVNVICLIIGVGGFIAHVASHAEWLLWVFYASIALGLGAQMWLVIGFMRSR
ncbi:MAG: hypothetical protein U1E50_11905 [Caulobacteraceae bacterium]